MADPFEITEPSAYVDYPEAENYNQYDNIDILRLHTAGAKLQNKILSTETGASLNIHASSAQSRLNQNLLTICRWLSTGNLACLEFFIYVWRKCLLAWLGRGL